MENKEVINVLQTLAENVNETCKEYVNEKITKEDKAEDIKTHITVAKLRVDKIIKEIKTENGNEDIQRTGRLRN